MPSSYPAAEIDKRGESLDDEDLDNAYYQAIAHLMERTDEATHLPGHKIWQYPLEWFEHRAHRDGYLFFGSPNDRPTAYPARDFYLYFVQPYDPPKFKDEEKPDEVFLRLASKDEALTAILRRFSAASALAAINTGNAKTVYTAKAEDALKSMRKWLRDQQTTAFNVTYQGKTRTLAEWAKSFSVRDRAGIKGDETVNFREYVNVCASYLLSSHFEEQYPEYPTFGTIVTDANRRMLCTTAIKSLSAPSRPKDAVMILDALQLLDGEKLDPRHSPYAQEIVKRLEAKGAGQVLNRSEIFEATSMAEAFAPGRFALEPDLVAVVLAALVYAGDVVVSVAGRKVDSSNLSEGSGQLVDDLAAFKHVEAPKDVNVRVANLRHVGLWLDFLRMELAKSDRPLSVQLAEELVGQFTRNTHIPETNPSNDEVVSLENLWDLCAQEQPFPHISSLIRFIEELRSDDLGRLMGGASASPPVVVSTIHKVKGLEFDNVVVLPSNLPFGNGPYGKSSDLEGDAAEEARLLYVAMTRAKGNLWQFVGDREYSWAKSSPASFNGQQTEGCVLIGSPEDVGLGWAMQRNFFNEDPEKSQAYIEREVKMGDSIILGGRGKGAHKALFHRNASGAVRQVGFLANKHGAGNHNADLQVSAVIRFYPKESTDTELSPVVIERGWGYVVLVSGRIR